MKTYRPLKDNYLTQRFAENAACARLGTDGKVERPFIIKGKTGASCPVGWTDFYTAIGMTGHPGEDWYAPRGTQVYFDVDIPGMRWWGRVEWDDAQGMNMDIFSLDPVPFEALPKEATQLVRQEWERLGGKVHIKRRFTHGYKAFLEDKPLVQVGVFSDGRPEMRPEIKLGDLVMLADNTGASAGDHLHRALKFCTKNSMTIGADNGFLGAFDETPYFDNRFVLDVLGNKPVSTAERLEALARQYELEGKHKEAGWIRAIIKVVVAFGG